MAALRRAGAALAALVLLVAPWLTWRSFECGWFCYTPLVPGRPIGPLDRGGTGWHALGPWAVVLPLTAVACVVAVLPTPTRARLAPVASVLALGVLVVSVAVLAGATEVPPPVDVPGWLVAGAAALVLTLVGRSAVARGGAGALVGLGAAVALLAMLGQEWCTTSLLRMGRVTPVSFDPPTSGFEVLPVAPLVILGLACAALVAARALPRLRDRRTAALVAAATAVIGASWLLIALVTRPSLGLDAPNDVVSIRPAGWLGVGLAWAVAAGAIAEALAASGRSALEAPSSVAPHAGPLAPEAA